MAVITGAGGARFKKLLPAYTQFNPHWVGFAQLGIPRYGGAAFVYGNVMYVVGGVGRTGVSSAVERIDLNTLGRSYGAPMPEPRAHFAFGLAGSKLYVLGGVDRGATPTNTIFVYDIVNNSWSTLAVTLPKRVAYCASATLHRTFLRVVVGIKPSSYGGTATYIKIYIDGVGWVDQVPGTFRIEGGVPKADFDVTPYVGRRVTRVGLHHTGGGWSDPTDVWIWDKATGTQLYYFRATSHVWDRSFPDYFEYVNVDWTVSGVTPTQTATIYVVGGIDEEGNVLRDVYVFNPENNSVTQVASLSIARQNHACAVLQGMIYCFGGDDGSSPLSSIEVYDPSANRWTLLDVTLPKPLTGLAAVTVNIRNKDYILLIGG